MDRTGQTRVRCRARNRLHARAAYTPRVQLPICDHPSLLVAARAFELPAALGELSTEPTALACLGAAHEPMQDELRKAVRDMLRLHGYRPTGRGKPSSEYLRKAAAEGRLASINAVVDAGNAASLSSGLPISVVDLDRAVAPLRIDLPEPKTEYVFNPSGQVIDVGGLVCLFDAEGPCANAVTAAQRTKTDETTRRVLTIVWGCVGEEERVQHASELLAKHLG